MTSKCCALFLSAGLTVLLPTVARAQQPVTIAGHVSAENGNPIPNATVAVPALGLGANVSPDGKYALVIPADKARVTAVTLSIRAIGYKPASADVPLAGTDITLDFVLASNPLQLGELVVTGAGTQSEVEKLGSVRNNVDSTQIAHSNEASLVNAMAAKAPNVEVVSASGDPGASASIRIRGVNTLSSDGQPLFVVDGQPIDNSVATTAALDPQTGGLQGGVSSPNRVSDINPADIESIEFLKGAAAGAVYGARAGQGVVLITTKRGRAGATQYSLRSNLEWSKINRVPALQQRFGQGDPDPITGAPTADPCAEAARSATPILNCSASENTWGPELAPGTPTYDHAREIYKTGFGTDNTITMSGGNDRTTFFFSGSLLSQNGVVFGPNNDFNRKSFRVKGDHRVFDNLRIGGNVSYTNSRQLAIQKGFNFSGITWGGWRTPPEFNNLPFTTTTADSVQRSFRFPSPSFGNDNDTRGYDNPFWSAQNALSSSIVGRTIGNLTLDFTPVAWLKLSYTLGVDDGQDSRLQGQPPSTSNTPDPRGQVIKQTLVNTQWDHNLIGTASYRLGGVSGTVSVGQNLNSRSFRQQGQVGNGMIAAQPFTLNNTSSFPPPLDRETKVRVAGYFAQATVDFGGQLFLKGGLRYDGASTFAPESRWAWFPSASVAWQFTKTAGDFGGLLSYGKLRMAYGEVGTQPSPYLGAQVYQSGTFNDFDAFGVFSGQNGVGGLFTPELKPATRLKPERTREFEAGIDIGLFKDAADLSFTWYRRSSADVILQVPVAASIGYQLEGANAAKIRNSGTELALNVRPITRRNFAWDVGVVFSTNRNRVEDLRGATFVPFGGGGGGIQGGAQSVAQVGEQIGIFRDYDYVRCGNGVTLTNTTDGSAYNVDANCSAGQIAQKALFIDDGTFVNESGAGSAGAGFPLLDPTQRIVGDPNPRWTSGLRTGFRIGNVSLGGLLDIRHGGVIWNGTRAALNAVGTSKETERRGESVVFGTNFFPGPVAGPGAGQSATLDQNFFSNYDGWSFSSTIGTPFYESASFVRLREVSIGYTLRNAFVTRTLGFSNVELRLAGRNLALWTDYSGVDPETNLGGSETPARGIDFFNNPQTRSFIMSVTLNR